MTNTTLLTPEAFLRHWLGHNALTRRTIEAFPEDKLFGYSLADMRPFGAMGAELLLVGEMTLDGLKTGQWAEPDWSKAPSSKADLLSAWDALTKRIETEFADVNPARFSELQKLPWGMEMPGWDAAIYNLDNQVHHRGQGYVYLRSLGIEPPAFWERQ